MVLLKNHKKRLLLPLLFVMMIAGCENRPGLNSTPVVISPTVSSTNPVALSANVALNNNITATFSETMDSTTITTGTFVVMQGAGFVSGTVLYAGTTALFAPDSNLLPNTNYTATITTGARNLEGVPMANSYVWNFTTGTVVVVTAPTVIATDPPDAGTAIPVNQKVAATFSVPMDPTTLSAATVTLKQGVIQIASSVGYSGNTVIITPSNILVSNTSYTATITTAVKDLAGNALANTYAWTFTTGALAARTDPVIRQTDPADGSTGVALNKHISATFTTTMDATTITTSTFTVKQGATIVPGTVGYIDSTATFIPLNPLILNAAYTVTITTKAKDLTGNSMANNYVWSFTTVAPYTVTIEANPLSGGTTSGQGTFEYNAPETLSAQAEAGYKFVNWTENGVVVSTHAEYAFTLVGNRAFVANFIVGPGGLPVVLGTSGRFAILSNSAITNIATSSITGDVGLSPGARSDITGLTIPEVTGTIYAADDAIPVPAMLIAAKNDAEAAYLNAVAAARGTPISISGNINGLTLVPGLYESGTSIEISPGGILYLDAQGDANAVFVFRSATSITTESTSAVVLTNNANAKNIYWVAGSAVTLGTNSRMKGTVIASTSISLLTGARLDGRALIQGAAAGQVSLDQSTIVLP